MMERDMQQGDILVIAGDASNVEDKEVQVKLLQMARKMGLKLYLDSSGAFMKKGIEYAPYMIKPNLEELSEDVYKRQAQELARKRQALAFKAGKGI